MEGGDFDFRLFLFAKDILSKNREFEYAFNNPNEIATLSITEQQERTFLDQTQQIGPSQIYLGSYNDNRDFFYSIILELNQNTKNFSNSQIITLLTIMEDLTTLVDANSEISNCVLTQRFSCYHNGKNLSLGILRTCYEEDLEYSKSPSSNNVLIPNRYFSQINSGIGCIDPKGLFTTNREPDLRRTLERSLEVFP